jgi:DNA invertase Pin-like site-specific DNA recombinase
MRVAVYTRVSGKSNRQDAANQSLQLGEYCRRQGWEFVEYTDRMSGTRADRAAFVQMFEDARVNDSMSCCSGPSIDSAGRAR